MEHTTSMGAETDRRERRHSQFKMQKTVKMNDKNAEHLDLQKSSKTARTKLLDLQSRGVNLISFFSQCDTNRTGYISYDDFCGSLIAASAGLNTSDARKLAKHLDRQKVGGIAYQKIMDGLTEIASTSSSSSSSFLQQQQQQPQNNSRHKDGKARSNIDSSLSDVQTISALANEPELKSTFMPSKVIQSDIPCDNNKGSHLHSYVNDNLDLAVNPVAHNSFMELGANEIFVQSLSPNIPERNTTRQQKAPVDSSIAGYVESLDHAEYTKLGNRLLHELHPGERRHHSLKAQFSLKQEPFEEQHPEENDRYYYRFAGKKEEAPFYVDKTVDETKKARREAEMTHRALERRGRTRASSAPPATSSRVRSLSESINSQKKAVDIGGVNGSTGVALASAGKMGIIPHYMTAKKGGKQSLYSSLLQKRVQAKAAVESTAAKQAHEREVADMYAASATAQRSATLNEAKILQNTVVQQVAGRLNGLRHMMKKQDPSASGVVTYTEFERGLRSAGVMINASQVQALFASQSQTSSSSAPPTTAPASSVAVSSQLNETLEGSSSSGMVGKMGVVDIESFINQIQQCTVSSDFTRNTLIEAAPLSAQYIRQHEVGRHQFAINPPKIDDVSSSSKEDRDTPLRSQGLGRFMKSRPQRCKSSTSPLKRSVVAEDRKQAVTHPSQSSRSISERAQEQEVTRIMKKVLHAATKQRDPSLAFGFHSGTGGDRNRPNGIIGRDHLSDALNTMGAGLSPHEFSVLMNHLETAPVNSGVSGDAVNVSKLSSHLTASVHESDQRAAAERQEALHHSKRYTDSYRSNPILTQYMGGEEYSNIASGSACRQEKRRWGRLKNQLQAHSDAILDAFVQEGAVHPGEEASALLDQQQLGQALAKSGVPLNGEDLQRLHAELKVVEDMYGNRHGETVHARSSSNGTGPVAESNAVSLGAFCETIGVRIAAGDGKSKHTQLLDPHQLQIDGGIFSSASSTTIYGDHKFDRVENISGQRRRPAPTPTILAAHTHEPSKFWEMEHTGESDKLVYFQPMPSLREPLHPTIDRKFSKRGVVRLKQHLDSSSAAPASEEYARRSGRSRAQSAAAAARREMIAQPLVDESREADLIQTPYVSLTAQQAAKQKSLYSSYQESWPNFLPDTEKQTKRGPQQANRRAPYDNVPAVERGLINEFQRVKSSIGSGKFLVAASTKRSHSAPPAVSNNSLLHQLSPSRHHHIHRQQQEFPTSPHSQASGNSSRTASTHYLGYNKPAATSNRNAPLVSAAVHKYQSSLTKWGSTSLAKYVENKAAVSKLDSTQASRKSQQAPPLSPFVKQESTRPKQRRSFSQNAASRGAPFAVNY